MCITSADARGDEEMMVWSILCDNCKAKAEALFEERKACNLLDLDMEEYGFCFECTEKITEAFDTLEEAEFGGEIP